MCAEKDRESFIDRLIRLPERAEMGIIRFLRDEHATTAVEYCVMLALIILVVVGSVSMFGNSQSDKWGRINTELQTHGF